MASSPSTATTSYLLENLHCPSCVSAIKSELSDTYGRRITWVSPNLVTSVVTIEHEDTEETSVATIKKTLEDIGFDVSAIDTTARKGYDIRAPLQDDLATPSAAQSSHYKSREQNPVDVPLLWLEKRPTEDQELVYASHLEVCEDCRSASSGDASPHVTSPKISPIGSTKPIAAGKDAGTLESVVVAGATDGPMWRAILSVDGMTCSACVNTLNGEIGKIPWVSSIVVSLVGNSATVYLTDPDRVNQVAEAIEDLGYGAVVDSVVNVSETKKLEDWREVQIRINGMFCPRCPQRLSRSLGLLGSHRLHIVTEPTLGTSLMGIRYRPDAPSFTIRHILSAISATDPSLQPSIHHPPTMEERSRAIRAKHQKALWRREMLTLVIAIPTFVLGIVYMALVPESNHTRHYLMEPWSSGISRVDLILCLLATPVWLYAADVFHKRAFKELRAMWRPASTVPLPARFYRFGSMDLLISLGTTVAYVSSVAQMITTAASADTTFSEGLTYFDTVVFLVLFILAGRLIEAYSKSRAGNAVEMLTKLRPDTALLVEQDKSRGQTTTKIPLDHLDHGDIIMVPSGASPAVDGIIVTGSTNFDESSLTGESRPVSKGEGDEVFSGTVNKGAAVKVRVTGTAGKSMLDKIVEVVREGQTRRAPMEQIAEVLTSYFVPAVTLVAIITWMVWLALGLSGSVSSEDIHSSRGWVSFAFRFAIAVFVVACPCGLGLAAPTAIFVGGGLAAKHGILAKSGGEAFEKAFRVDCIVLDKTGTLTEGGEPRVTDSVALPDGDLGGMSGAALWSSLRAVEESSSHPIARAIVDFCGSVKVAVEVEDVQELPGKGMTAACQLTGNTLRFRIAVGNARLMKDLSVHNTPDSVTSQLDTWKKEAKSVALVAVQQPEASQGSQPDGPGSWVFAAALAVSDPIRREAPAAIAALRGRGIQVWMLSGDNETTALAVAERVGIPCSNVLAEVLPSQKADKVKYLQATLRARGGRGRAMVAMVGDGINDSPALAAADVGIAIGSGSDVAISSADFVLATSNLGAVPTLLDLSRTVFRRIRANFAWAIIYNMAAIPFAAGCFYAVRTSGGSRVILVPEFAALAMALSSISVVLSSLSLRSGLPLVGFRPSHTVE